MFVADLHNDLVQRIMIGEDISKLTSNGHTDIPRLKNSSINLEVLIIWVSNKSNNFKYFEKANLMYDKLESLGSIESVVVPKNINDILDIYNKNQLLLPISIEGGEALENKIENLYHFIERGLLYFGPTWNHSLDWVSSAYDETHHKSSLKTFGLDEFGIKVLKTCEENNVVVDVSHIGEKSFWDIYKNSSKPFIASHSSVDRICPHYRNLKDDQLKAIKEKKGIVGINPYPFFIDPTFEKREKNIRKKFKKNLEEIDNKFSDKYEQWLNKQHFLQIKLSNIAPDISVFIDHIDYVVNLIGIDYVGIGSDYDGLDCLPKGWKDCQDHIKISQKLDQRGYKTNDIEKIMGRNFIRVLETINY